MRKEFVECEYPSIAKSRCPWAAVIVRVEGGYMAFESMQDYKTWKGQR